MSVFSVDSHHTRAEYEEAMVDLNTVTNPPEEVNGIMDEMRNVMFEPTQKQASVSEIIKDVLKDLQ